MMLYKFDLCSAYPLQMHMAFIRRCCLRLLSSPCIERPESTSLSMYLAISTSDLSAICNIKASVSVELNGNKREASIND